MKAKNDLRLQRILAQSGLASRRKAEELIRAGRVSVDGRVVTELGQKASPHEQRITVDGKAIPSSELKAYYLFNKPRKVISSLHDPQGRPTLKDFLVRANLKARLFPVGRLDWDAEGLMLLTNDGALALRLQHPRFQIPKIYRIKVEGIPTNEALGRLRSGIRFPGGLVHQAEVQRVKKGEDRSWLLLTIWEGEKHQVKTMCQAIGHPILSLKRVALGPLTLGRLAPGQIRPLSQQEVNSLRKLLSAPDFT